MANKKPCHKGFKQHESQIDLDVHHAFEQVVENVAVKVDS